MKLRIATPTAIVVDVDDVRHVRAEDATGAFGIRKGHADFLTVLTISVVTWQDAAEHEHFAAVRGGVLTVRDGERVEIATRDAVDEPTLARLGGSVLARFEEEAAAEEEARLASTRLQVRTIRQIEAYVRRPSVKLPRAVFGEGDGEEGIS